MFINSTIYNLIEKLEADKEKRLAQYSKMNPIEIFDDIYKINWCEEWYLFLTSYTCENLFRQNTDLCEWLEAKENPLDFLYNEWLSCEDVTNYDYDYMIDWLKEIYNRLKGM